MRIAQLRHQKLAAKTTQAQQLLLLRVLSVSWLSCVWVWCMTPGRGFRGAHRMLAGLMREAQLQHEQLAAKNHAGKTAAIAAGLVF